MHWLSLAFSPPGFRIIRGRRDLSLLPTPTNDPREVLDAAPESDDLLSGVLEVDVELESVSLPASERIDADDREVGEVRLRD